MKVIVANEAEVKLMKNFLLAVHELGFVDVMEEEDGKQGVDQYLNTDDYRILSEAVFHDQTTVVIDRSEPELCYAESNFVMGTCIHCGVVTEGLIEPQTLTYEDYQKMMSPESLKTWLCYECSKESELNE